MKDSFSKLRDVDSRIHVMINDLLASRDKKGGRVAESSFKRIPSVKSFKVKVGANNELLLGTGLERKMPADFEFILHKEQDKANRYMEVRIKAMRAVLKKGRPDIFWAIVENEMKRSVCFRTSAFNAVFPGWYKNMDYQRAVQINFGVEHLIRNNINELKYFRVEIPKGNPEEIARWFKENPDQAWPGKMRPLGVPTAPWRVVLHMWNGFLTIFLEEELKEFNHAYMPNVGTLTAWKDFIIKVRSSKFIYEFDIKGFFNNVSIYKTMHALRDRGMPLPNRKNLFEVLVSCPANISLSDMDSIKSEYDASLAKRQWYINKKGVPDILLRNLNLAPAAQEQMTKGLPQGAAPSTILSLLALSDWYQSLKAKGIELLMYADDGIMYSDQDFTPTPPPGFEFAEDKSRWLKRISPVVEEVKFLGVKYNFKSELIKGSTRNGSELEFGPLQENFLSYLTQIVPNTYGDMMAALVKSNIFGLTLSKLYGGKFGNLHYDENVTYHKKSYWARFHDLKELEESKKLQKTASTAACGWLLLLNTHVMCSKDKDWFFEQSKRYHKLKPWEISSRDIMASLKWQETWDRDKEADSRPIL